MEKNLTIIIPTYNNYVELEYTLKSILEFRELYDLVIVDSSDHYPLDFEFKNVLSESSLWVEPNGVYDAINRGVDLCETQYLMTLNSGDAAVTRNLKECILSYLYIERADIDILVGAQDVVYRNIAYKYVPELTSVWPHQSVIYKARLHEEYGNFDTEYKLVSDQMFFEKIKCSKMLTVKFISCSLTVYDVTGISSIMNGKSLVEYKALNKLRGKNNIKLYLRYVFYKLSERLNFDFNLYWHSLKSLLKG